jgi:hypothetical protein
VAGSTWCSIESVLETNNEPVGRFAQTHESNKKVDSFQSHNVVVAAQDQGEVGEEEQEAAQGTGLQSRRRTSV